MKRLLLYTLFVLTCISCASGRRTIHLAKSRALIDSPYSKLLESYAEAYSALPQSMQQLRSYATKVLNYYGVDDFWDVYPGDTPLLIEDIGVGGSAKLVCFNDSCFLYSYRYDIGAVLYGRTPVEWAYDSYWSKHWWRYLPSFIGIDGDPIFVPYDPYITNFNHGLDSLCAKSDYQHQLRIYNKGVILPYKIFFIYSKQNGLKRIDSFDESDKSFYIAGRDQDLESIPPEDVKRHLSRQYMDDLEHYLNDYLTKNWRLNISEVRFLSYMVF